ncbi:M48 family metalloprotease (plasmid) [Tistrella mobilis]|uniref:M48 family metalloprotease n=1 Tax=Tistrella mobilis TaxID=171437 RepID=UPI0035564490
MTRTRRPLPALAGSALLLTGCVTGGINVPGLSDDSISGMKAPVIETAQFDTTLPSSAGDPRPPRTLYFSGAADDVGTNYWRQEQDKVPIPEASRVIPDAKIQAYLRGILLRLLAVAPPGAPDVQVHLLASSGYQAMARPDGDIYVSINVLAQAGSEDEVAMMLGHELGHLLLQHHDKDKLFKEQRDATTMAAGAFVLGTVLKSQVDAGGGNLTGSQKAGLQQDANTVMATKWALDFIGKDVVGAAWNRQQENEADLLGIDLISRAGYAPLVAQYGLEKIVAGEKARGTMTERLQKLSDERTKRVEAEMQVAWSSGNMTVTPVVGAMLDAGTDVGREIVDAVSGRYASGEERLQRSWDYNDKFYADAPGAPHEGYEEIKTSLGIKDMNNAYADVIQALFSLSDGNYDDAEARLKSGYGTDRIGDHPLPRMIEALIHQGRGRDAAALQALQQVSPDLPMPIEGYTMKATLEASKPAGMNRWQAITAAPSKGKAKSKPQPAGNPLVTLETAQAIYGLEAVQPTRIAVLARMGDKAQARAAYDACQNLSEITRKQCSTTAVAVQVAEAEQPVIPLPDVNATPAEPKSPSLRSLLGFGG